MKGLESATLEKLLVANSEWVSAYVDRRIPASLRPFISSEDICQEIWLEAFQSGSRYRPDGPDSFNRWLMTIANRQLIDTLRVAQAGKRRGSVQRDNGGLHSSSSGLFAQLASSGRSPSRELSAKEAACAVQLALTQLPEDYRRAVCLRYVEGRSRDDIAALLQKPKQIVNNMLFRALRQLQKHLSDAARFMSEVRSFGADVDGKRSRDAAPKANS